MRPPSPEDARTGTAAQLALLVAAVAQLDDEAFATPTRLPGWTVAELVGHMAAFTESVTNRIEEPPPPATDVDIYGYLLRMREHAPKIAQRAVERVRGVTPADLRHRFATAVDKVTAALPDVDLDRPVTKALGTISMGDFLVTRCLEGVVHGQDLGGVDPDPTALKVVVRTFAGLLENVAPGRSVEVRVPGHVAVQCGEGPRHARGTPGNVVEADPVPFVEMCAGRLSWADAVGRGTIRPSGKRADLSPYVPLIG